MVAATAAPPADPPAANRRMSRTVPPTPAPPAGLPVPVPEPAFEALPTGSLYDLARARGVFGRSLMSRAELVAALARPADARPARR